MTTNLKSVNIGMNKYCGPAVLSILTGRNTDDCAYTISQINGQYSVAGVMLPDLLKAADRLGFTNIPIAGTAGFSLFRALISIAPADGMYIVTIRGHFVVIEVLDSKLYFCDNHTKEPIPAASSARLSMEVVAVNKVFKKPEPPPKPTPVLLDKQIRVTVNDSSIDIKRLWLYEDKMDNREEYLGEIKAASDGELREIVMKIKDTFFRLE